MSADMASIGKGIVQLNLRLNRVLELLERPVVMARGAGDECDVALDLVDALERALERPETRRGWWSRWFGEGGDAGLRRGIEVARARAVAQLEQLGVVKIDTTDRFDPAVHEALERLPAPAGVAAGTIARTHRTGFLRREGTEVRVLRAAQVSVYGGEAPREDVR